MLVTLEIPSKDRSYPWFLEWMALHAPQHGSAPHSSHPSASSTSSGGDTSMQVPPPRGIAGLRAMLSGKAPLSLRSHELAVETAFKQHENGSSEAVFNLVPGPGTHYFRYRNAWFQVSGQVKSRPLSPFNLHLSAFLPPSISALQFDIRFEVPHLPAAGCVLTFR